MEARQQRGQELSSNKRIKKVEGSLWLVPSQTTPGANGYLVNITTDVCTCPDHETRRVRCKHRWAVEFFLMKTRACPQTSKDRSLRKQDLLNASRLDRSFGCADMS